jgi:hypothetical protein
MLTTLPIVKTRLSIKTEDVIDDDFLTNLIAMATARFENDCNRTFGYAQNQADEFEGYETELRVSHYPIDSTQPITFAICEDFASGYQPVTAPKFVLRKNFIISLVSTLGRGKMQMQVTYSGGFVLPDGTSAIPQGGTSKLLPDDISLAVTDQIAYWYHNKDRLGLTSLHTAGAGFTQSSKLDLLPHVAAVIAKYERWMN